MKKYSFIVLSYNSRKTIEKCIQSIFEVGGDVEKEILLVDNASADNTVSFVKERFGDRVRYVENTTNKGFSCGVNDGFKRATGDFCVLLNPDADVVSLDFSKVEQCFTDTKVGILAPKVVYPDGRVQPSFGSFPTRVNLFLYFFKIAPLLPGGFLIYDNIWNRSYYQSAHTVDWVSGAFMIIPRKVLEEVNYFDEAYFLYVEDIDFCKRVHERGFRVVVDPSITISHILQASVKRDPIKNFEHQRRGFIRYFETHYQKNVSWFIGCVYGIYKLKKRFSPRKP